MDEHTRVKGNRAEAQLLAALLNTYETVLLPYGGNCRYDLAVDTDDGFRRIQCKNGRLREGAIRFNTSSSTMHHRGGKRRSYYGEADYFGIYCPDTGASYLVPVDDCGGVQAALRVTPPVNGQVKGIRWAKDYQL